MNTLWHLNIQKKPQKNEFPKCQLIPQNLTTKTISVNPFQRYLEEFVLIF